MVIATYQTAFFRQDGSISIESLDRNSKLLLAPHGRSYVVEWWQPVPSTDRRFDGREFWEPTAIYVATKET